MNPSASKGSGPEEPWLEVSASRHFTAWMAENGLSVACTTYQTGKLLLFGRKPDGDLAVFERTFNRCMGLWADPAHGQTLWMSSLYQLWRLENALRPGETHQGHDRLYVPRIGFTTGDLDVHDIAVESSGRVVFVATGFGCLATVSERASFAPLWRPAHLSRLAAEDRCHLNGLALEDGKCRYVSAVSTSDVVDGWRDRRRDGGVVLEVPTSRIVCEGLSMPHSPRLHRGELWVLDSATAGSARSRTASSSVSRSVPAICAGSPSSALTPSSACRCPGTTRRSAAWLSTRNWPAAAPNRAAAWR